MRYSFAVTLMLAGSLSAQSQSTISPSDGVAFGNISLLNTIGGGNPLLPFAYFPNRFQQIYNHDSFTNSRAVVVRSINYRMAPAFANGRFGGQTTRVKIRMSLAANGVHAASFSNQFASNLDNASVKVVLNTKTVTLPKLSNTSFGFKLPLTAPFVWSGAATRRALVIEVFQYGNSNASRPFSYQIDAWSSVNARIGSAAPNGTYAGCRASDTRVVAHSANAGRFVVGNASHFFNGNSRVPSLPGAVVLGARSIDVTLPGTSCKLVNDILALVPAVSSTRGAMQVPFPIVNDVALGGVILWTQMAWLDARANRLGVTTSAGLKQRIGLGRVGPTRTSTVAQWTDQNGNPDRFTVGRPTRGFGLITQLTN